MTILFCGGELDDFTCSGTLLNDTNLTYFRSAYARCAVYVQTGATNYAMASFTPTAQFSVTARMTDNTTSSGGSAPCILALGIGGNHRLRLKFTAGSPSPVALVKFDGTTETTLATSTSTLSSGVLYRLDMIVDYQAAGRFRLYIDQTLYIDYSGDITAAGSTSLSQLSLYSMGSSSTTRWSEVIVSTQDSRSLSLKTLVPDATGDLSAWTGTWSDVDDATASETDVMYSASANQMTSLNCTGMPAGASGLSIRAVRVVASACCGATGPQGLQLGVRQSNTNAFATAHTLTTGYTTISDLWETNPITGSAFTPTEIDNLQLDFQSVA